MKRFILLIVCMLMACGMLRGQVCDTLRVPANAMGVVSQNDQVPFGNALYSYCQTIYLAQDIGRDGYIDTLWLSAVDNYGYGLDTSFTVWLGHVPQNCHHSLIDWADPAQLVQVFHSDSMAFPNSLFGSFNMALPLDTAFYYNGVDNLVLVIACHAMTVSVVSAKCVSLTNAATLIKRSHLADETGRMCGRYVPNYTGTISVQQPELQLSMRAPRHTCATLTSLEAMPSVTSVWLDWEPDSLSGAGYGSYIVVVDTLAEGMPPDTSNFYTVGTHPFTVSSLLPATRYRFWVRSHCAESDGLWRHVEATTLPMPEPVPFYDDFEDSTLWGRWNLQSNNICRWTRGSGATTAGSAMYISPDGVTYSTGTTAVLAKVYAYVPLYIEDAGIYDIDYDWRNGTPNANSSMRVLLVPDTSMWDPLDYHFDSVPAGGIALDGGRMYNQSTWTHYSNQLYIPSPGYYNLSVNWHCQYSYFGGAYVPGAIDNIQFRAALCVNPDSATVYDTDTSSADLVIYGQSYGVAQADNYAVIYHQRDAEQYDTLYANSTNITLAHLTPGTAYEGVVYANCGEGMWSPQSVPFGFTTQCAPIYRFPHTESFEHPLSHCWQVLGNSSYTVYGGMLNVPDTLLTPELAGQLSNYYLDYQVRSTSGAAGYIGAVEENDTSWWIVPIADLDTAPSGTANVFHRRIVSLGQYSGGGHRLALVDTNSAVTRIDDFTIAPIPQCPTVENLTVQMGRTSALLQWDTLSPAPTSGVALFQVEVYDSLENLVGFYTTSQTRILLDTLLPNSDYLFRVSAECHDATVGLPCQIAGTTFCAEGGDVHLGNGTTYETYTVPIFTLNSYSYTQQLITADEMSGPARIKGLQLTLNSGSLEGKDHVAIYLGHTDAENLSVSFAPMSDALLVYDSAFNFTPGTIDIMFDTAFYYDGVSNLVLAFDDNSGVGSAFLGFPMFQAFQPSGSASANLKSRYAGSNTDVVPGDSINNYTSYASAYRNVMTLLSDCIERPCPMPDFYVDSIGGHDIAFTWSGLPTQSWTVDFRACGDSAWIPVLADTNLRHAHIGALIQNTCYQVRVAPTCDTSAAYIYTFLTNCDLEEIPFVEDFESWLVYGETVIPRCWNLLSYWSSTTSSTSNWELTASDFSAYSPERGVVVELTVAMASRPSLLILPAFAVSTDSLTLDFEIRMPYNITVDVGVITDPADSATYTPIANVDLPGYSQWRHFHTDFFDWNRPDGNLAIRVIGGAVYLDSIVVDKSPRCPVPRNLSVDSTSFTTADLSWTCRNSGVYEIEYGTHGYIAGYGHREQTTAFSFQLTELVNGHYYDVRIRTLCPTGDTSDWSEPVSFSLPCGDFAVPFSENFEATDATAYAVVGVLPNCWDAYANAGAPEYGPHVRNGATYNYPHSGARTLALTAGRDVGTVKMARMPNVSTPIEHLRLSFFMTTESATEGTLEVGYMTGVSYVSDYHMRSQFNASTASSHSGGGGCIRTVLFGGVPEDAQYIVFRWTNIQNTPRTCCIDDIQVSLDTSCSEPADITVHDIDSYEATLSWSGSSEQYDLAVRVRGTNGWPEPERVEGLSHLITGLELATHYDYRLRQVCGSTYSLWVTGNFVTDNDPCTAPTNLVVDTLFGNQVHFSWTPGGTEQRWIARLYNSAVDRYDTLSSPTGYFLGLESGVHYNLAVKSLCSAGVTSAWSDPVDFTTFSCNPVSHVSILTHTDVTATVGWVAGENNGSLWQIDYGYSDFPEGSGTTVEVSQNPYTITDLEQLTEYDVYVRAVCEQGFTSIWSSPALRFTTSRSNAIGEVPDSLQVRLYPNPAHSAFVADCPADDWNLSIIDLQGREVRHQQHLQGPCRITGLPAGTYFVRVYTATDSRLLRLIVL